MILCTAQINGKHWWQLFDKLKLLTKVLFYFYGRNITTYLICFLFKYHSDFWWTISSVMEKFYICLKSRFLQYSKSKLHMWSFVALKFLKWLKHYSWTLCGPCILCDWLILALNATIDICYYLLLVGLFAISVKTVIYLL